MTYLENGRKNPPPQFSLFITLRGISKNTDTPYSLDIIGAEGRTRTVTGLPPLDFESSASTNSTTSAL